MGSSQAASLADLLYRCAPARLGPQRGGLSFSDLRSDALGYLGLNDADVGFSKSAEESRGAEDGLHDSGVVRVLRDESTRLPAIAEM
jgi:hypothetical protein